MRKPQTTTVRLIQYRVADFFEDESKTKLWFETPNPLLGQLSPNDMILMGKADRLLKFVDQNLEANKRGYAQNTK